MRRVDAIVIQSSVKRRFNVGFVTDLRKIGLFFNAF